jgi:hypothetical protein
MRQCCAVEALTEDQSRRPLVLTYFPRDHIMEEELPGPLVAPATGNYLCIM